MDKIASIILAAGKGTRMKSGQAKVLHPAAGRPMIAWSVAAARAAGADSLALVVGHQAEQVAGLFNGEEDIRIVLQAEQLGTGHAVACAREALSGFDGTVLILCGDTPLLTPETLTSLIDYHRSKSAAVTVLTAVLQNPHGYGRLLRDKDGGVLGIVEEKDASDEQRLVTEINSGIYCMDSAFLFENIDSLNCDNAQKELYLTDLVAIAVGKGDLCLAMPALDSDEIMGVNDRIQLAEASRILRGRINNRLMAAGVSMVDPLATYIDHSVSVAEDTVIFPGCTISGNTTIGRNCLIEAGVSISDSRIGDGCQIKAGSVLEGAELGNEVAVGPMARLRPGTILADHVKIGNFVETKKTVMGAGSKASHLTYLGDAEIGRDVNIGCGTITCNYDGVNKYRTVIEDDVFIGSDVQLVAPVRVGRNSLVAAGTTVTSDVPADSLAISRVPQQNKRWRRLKKKSS